jgi:NADH-quinone oxidoreductase subunit L
VSAVLALLVAVPAVVGLVLLALPVLAGTRGERAAAPVSVGAATAVLGLAVVTALIRPELDLVWVPGLSAGLAVDGLSAALVLTVAGAALPVLLWTVRAPGEGRRRLAGLLLVFTAAMLLVVTATDLALLLLGWELVGLTSYALIGHSWREPSRVDAGITAFLTTRLGDVGLYVAVGAAVAGGGVGLDHVAPTAGGSGWAQVAVAGIVVAALGKSAQLPFSGWLSGAMLGPSPASALLHSATMVAAGGYLLLRVHPLLESTGWDNAVAWAGAATAVVMGTVALAQRDLKQLLAASTCAQLGFVLVAAGTGATTGGVLALVAHAATKSLLFLCAGSWLDAQGTKDLTALRGVGRHYPAVGVASAVGALSLAGVPPLALWVGKEAALAGSTGALYVAGLLGAVLSAAYGARVLAVVLGPPETGAELDTERRGTRQVGVPAVLAVAGLAALTVAIGVVGLARADLRPAAGELVVAGVLSVLVVAGVVLLDRRRAGRTAPVLLDWWGLRRLLDGVGASTLRVAGVLAAADERLVAASLAAPEATGPARFETTLIEGPLVRGVTTLATGTRRLGVVARRPQTGLLHTYYAQAVLALVVLAATLVLVR